MTWRPSWLQPTPLGWRGWAAVVNFVMLAKFAGASMGWASPQISVTEVVIGLTIVEALLVFGR